MLLAAMGKKNTESNSLSLRESFQLLDLDILETILIKKELSQKEIYIYTLFSTLNL